MDRCEPNEVPDGVVSDGRPGRGVGRMIGYVLMAGAAISFACSVFQVFKNDTELAEKFETRGYLMLIAGLIVVGG